MKRLCIYVTYDFENIVDDYISYILSELRKSVEYLVVVCNSESIPCGIKKIQKYADKIYYRQNIGFDAGAFKDALCRFIGWDKVLEYEELCLVNDSFFGPFCAFSTIFEQMERRETDFWGLISHAEAYIPEQGLIPEHIQSFFLAVQNRMLHSPLFRQYWETLPYFKHFDEVVSQHEIKFTQYFKERGFTCSVLADTRINDSVNICNNYMQYALISYELIQKRNFPFLKKQQIGYNTLDRQTQENIRRAIDYIDTHTEYDVNLIWDNLIRTMNMADLQRSLHLWYILDGAERGNRQHQDAVVAVSADFLSACEEVADYLMCLRPYFDIRIYTTNNQVQEYYKKQGFECIQANLDTCGELEKLGSYPYVCVVHDEDLSSDIKPSCVQKSHFFSIWKNLLGNTGHVVQIAELFERETKLGILSPPSPDFGEYFGELGKGWNGKYDRCRRVLDDKTVRCVLSQDKPPVCVSRNFWIRGEVLRGLGRFEEAGFDIMKYLWALLAQEKGYYAGIVESVEYASIREADRQYYLDEICSQVRQHCGSFGSLLELKKRLFQAELEQFCIQYARIYIYGTGYMAKKYWKLIPRMEGFIVSDGQPNAKSMEGMPVWNLSELELDSETGIVVCVDKKFQYQIQSILDKKGSHYICI